MDFLFDRSIGKSEKGFAKLFSWTAVLFLLIMRARTRPLFGFLNRTVKIQKTDISAMKSVFEFRVRLQIRNPDFKIEIQISRSNAPSAFFFLFLWFIIDDWWLSYNKGNNTFLNSLQKKEVEAKVEFTIKFMERAGERERENKIYGEGWGHLLLMYQLRKTGC